MKLQNLLMPKAGLCSQIKMYYRANKQVYLTDCHQALTFMKHGIVKLDTYFNSFSIEKWKKYTDIESVYITLQLQGAFEIQLLSKEKIHGVISEKELSVVEFRSEEPTEVTVPFLSYDNKGMFFVRLEAVQDNSKFFGGYYSGDLLSHEPWAVDIAINICTFRREMFVKRNLEILRREILSDPGNELSEHLQVFISDNGKTLDIAALSDEKVHIVPNKNVGGAGGFTRGLIEIMHCTSYHASHALFMDDDVMIEPEALFRTYTMLRSLKEEYREAFIGGAMLRLDQQAKQVESGAAWYAGNLTSRKSGLDLNSADACLYNEWEEYCEYNAWWYCCIPMTLVQEDNLPMPIFIRGDDLEYGLRNMKQLILLNGICVWHEPFENKYSSFLEYYILRNLLYDNALHCPNYTKWKFLKKLYGNVLRQLFYYRYKNVELIFHGVEDFFRGVDFLKETDGEKLHQEIMAAGYKAQPIEELDLPFAYPEYDASFCESESRCRKWLRMITFNGLILPAKRETVTSMALCRPINFYRSRRVLQYDVTSKKAFVTEKNIGKTIGYLFRLVPLTVKVLVKFKKSIKGFRCDASLLMKEDFWRRYLHMDVGLNE